MSARPRSFATFPTTAAATAADIVADTAAVTAAAAAIATATSAAALLLLLLLLIMHRPTRPDLAGFLIQQPTCGWMPDLNILRPRTGPDPTGPPNLWLDA